MPSTSGVKKSPRGRPRADGSIGSDHTREEIIRIASKLFDENGVANTSTSEIARIAGIRQPSLYHHFKNKGALVEAVVQRYTQLPLGLLEEFKTSELPTAEKIYRLIKFDVTTLCSAEFNIARIVGSAALRSGKEVDFFWKQRDVLVDEIEALILQGIENGELIDRDPRLLAFNLLNLSEGSLNWFKKNSAQSVTQAAELTAELALRTVIANQEQVEGVMASVNKPE